MRTVLPTRRPSETLSCDWRGHAITVTIGYYPDTGRVAEVFADVAGGGQMQAVLSDACVWASLALQHGATPAALLKSVGMEPAAVIRDGQIVTVDGPASPLGAIAAALRPADDAAGGA